MDTEGRLWDLRIHRFEYLLWVLEPVPWEHWRTTVIVFINLAKMLPAWTLRHQRLSVNENIKRVKCFILLHHGALYILFGFHLLTQSPLWWSLLTPVLALEFWTHLLSKSVPDLGGLWQLVSDTIELLEWLLLVQPSLCLGPHWMRIPGLQLGWHFNWATKLASIKNNLGSPTPPPSYPFLKTRAVQRPYPWERREGW